MAFSPVSLPIQEILLTNFVTDIATISNANSLVLKDKLEDLINNLEIDTTSLSIGTDNPISYVRAQSFVMQDTGFTFQTGSPAQVIAKLEKNVGLESILTIDRLNVNIAASIDIVSATDITATGSLTADAGAPTILNDSFQYTAQIIESTEAVTATVTNQGTTAEARITLTSASKKNILLTLNTVTSPALNYVYDGIGGFAAGLLRFALYIDFDVTNPPAQNSVFTITLVDVIENVTSTSIISYFSINTMPIVFRSGDNLSTTNPILLHSDSGYDVGINPSSGLSPDVLKSAVAAAYGHSLSLHYIIDQNLDDRLLITSTVGMEFFV